MRISPVLSTLFSQRSPGEWAISTGSLRLDLALCSMGIQRGVIIEISGLDCSGKTTLCQHIIAQAQKIGSLCAWIDADHTFDPIYANNCGVMLENLYFNEPTHTEQALDILESLASSGVFTILVLDSLFTLIPQCELSGALFQAACDENTYLLSYSLRRLTGLLQRTGTSIIFTDLTGSQSSAIYHHLEGHTYRLALKLHATQRIRLQPARELTSNHQSIGVRVQAKVLKSRTVPFYHASYFDIIHGQGINKSGEVLELGFRLNLIQKQKSGYTFRANNLGFSVQKAASFLDQNISTRDAIEMEIRQRLMPELNIAAT